MDIANGFMNSGDAQDYEFYNPDDKLAQAIVKGDATELSQILDGGWADSGENGLKPPLPPLTDPKHPKRKNGGLALPGEDPEEEEEALAAAAAGNVAEGTDNGEATAVGDGSAPDPGEDGSVEVGGTETPPDEGEEAGGEDTGSSGDEDAGTDSGAGDGEGQPDEEESGESGGGEDSVPVG
jgi:hypothetical protein